MFRWPAVMIGLFVCLNIMHTAKGKDIPGDDCQAADRIPERVSRVDNNGEVILTTGMRLRIADVHFPHNGKRKFVSDVTLGFLTARLEGKTVFYIPLGSVDRYRRLPAYIFLDNADESNQWLQQQLLEQGHAVFMPNLDNKGKRVNACYRGLMRKALQESEKLGSGVSMGAHGLVVPVYSASDDVLWQREGDFTIVEGVVLSTRDTRRGGTLNFGDDWKTDFTAVLTQDVKLAIEREQKSLSNLIGLRLQLRGFLDLYYGPSMRIDHPMQVEFLTR